MIEYINEPNLMRHDGSQFIFLFTGNNIAFILSGFLAPLLLQLSLSLLRLINVLLIRLSFKKV
jgi:hypothetical protein